MVETLVFGLIILLILGASTFYLYSRIVYSERKVSLMENLLLDIKMSLEMEREVHHDTGVEDVSSNIIEPSFDLLNKDDTEYYTTVLNSTTTEKKEGDDSLQPSNDEDVNTPEVVNYDSLTREELTSIAEKKGLRVTKRLNKQQIINLMRDADKTSSGLPETDSDAPVGGNTGSVEGSSLASKDLEDTTLENTQ
jgi:hypothetical protein